MAATTQHLSNVQGAGTSHIRREKRIGGAFGNNFKYVNFKYVGMPV